MVHTQLVTAPSIISRGSGALDSFRRSRPHVSIELAEQKDGLVNSYTTLDQINGEVVITVDHDISFDNVEISFEGRPASSLCHSHPATS